MGQGGERRRLRLSKVLRFCRILMEKIIEEKDDITIKLMKKDIRKKSA
jgi:hypothetical protein